MGDVIEGCGTRGDCKEQYEIPSCVVVGCSNRSRKPPRASFQWFPKHTELHKRWTAAVRHKNLPPNYWESVYVCLPRFQDSGFERDMLVKLMNVQWRELKIGAVSTYLKGPKFAIFYFLE